MVKWVRGAFQAAPFGFVSRQLLVEPRLALALYTWRVPHISRKASEMWGTRLCPGLRGFRTGCVSRGAALG